MSTVLHISSSLFGEQGQSTQLSRAFVTQWLNARPGADLIERDLGSSPIPHLSAAVFRAFRDPAAPLSAEQRAGLALSDELIAELRRADLLVLGLPMYNFGVPSSLKAYFDHVARAGQTFEYSSNGPRGLLSGKQAVVVAARGGQYLGTPMDTQSDYVRNFLGFLGISDVQFVYAEGLAKSGDAPRKSLDAAQRQISALAA